MGEPFVTARGLRKVFHSRGRDVTALDDVSFTLARGETLGLVGPSGSGKSTLARVLMRLIEPDAGAISIDGEDWLALRGRALRQRRGAIQMVFQEPLAAFNPRATIGGALDDPLRIHGIADRADRAERPRRIAELLERVGLPAGFAQRAVHEVSGGQRQRVAIARALATRPALIVLDEAVSALDVSVRGTILELLADVQKSDGIAYVFVSHDLAVVRVIAHRVAIMDAGRIVETGPTPGVIADPQSAMGRALVAAVPRLDFGRDDGA
ncbi:ATP-binding cassette domain-containing protein [Nitratireductor soli]|uniref:ATP-binding cassette domain-containing protein n=1 Tax=Nitratireductor soli TaxID=1670619 RepID=UPI00065DCEF8|nr:dipeptide/oligopeptide/nickel ABC transporter ATP-binding protein [Nitratireductor soli]